MWLMLRQVTYHSLHFLNRLVRKNYFGLALGLILLAFISRPFSSLALNGPHAGCIPDDPCGACHIPHHAADELMWARSVTEPDATGVKRLCMTCHGTHLFGAKNYFFLKESNDHPMGINASLLGPGVTRENWTGVPLKETEGGGGFYCGSCHDPHKDPFYNDPNDGGDYLREFSEGLIQNNQDKHYKFCIQCHAELIQGKAHGHGNKDGCFDCHTPHYSPNLGKKIILTQNYFFQAKPNIPGFSDPVAETYVSECYGCHRAESKMSGALGAPLHGDDGSIRLEHHPMGMGANTSTIGHQKEVAGPLSPAGELYCQSCHNPHDGSNAKYLNPDVIIAYDQEHPGAFCVACHSDKRVSDLGQAGKGHYQIGPHSECLFCHSIHASADDPAALYQTDNSRADQENASASVDVIMRIKPVNLQWSDQKIDIDIRDYEDMCYGCHANPQVVGKKETINEENSLLYDNIEEHYYSHRFKVVPTKNINIEFPFEDRKPVVSDGEESICMNDYGVETGSIWCGSCHNVHQQDSPPTSLSQEARDRRSAYLRTSNENSQLCICCHTNTPLHGISHPVNVPLNTAKIHLNDPFKDYAVAGYSGGIGGQTSNDNLKGNITCQSCHSVHSAVTGWHGISRDGNSGAGILLIIDNSSGGVFQDKIYDRGSGLCLNCHANTL